MGVTFEIARKYLAIPGSSVPSEQLFSKAGELISQRRSQLKPKNVDMLLFLNKKCVLFPCCFYQFQAESPQKDKNMIIIKINYHYNQAGLHMCNGLSTHSVLDTTDTKS